MATNVEISYTDESALIIFRNLNLSVEKSTSPEIELIVEKRPTQLLEGEIYYNNVILIDKETEAMKSLIQKAEALLEIPKIERPQKVLEILRSKVDYAFNEVIELIAKNNPKLATWVTENTGLNSKTCNIPLSHLIESGYGICRHLAVAYLWLAQKAGLKGVLLSSNEGTIKNIERTDGKGRLFKSVDVGQPVASHVWVEVQMSDSRWIPIDPSTKLVGDSSKNMEMFLMANYMGDLTQGGLCAEATPEELFPIMARGTLFAPAQATTSVVYRLVLRSTIPVICIGPGVAKDIPATNIPYVGDANLCITTRGIVERLSACGLNIKGVRQM